MDFKINAALIGLSFNFLLLLAAINWFKQFNHGKLVHTWLVAMSTLGVLQSIEFIFNASGLYHKWPVFLKIVDPLIVLLPLCIYGYMRALQNDNIFTNNLVKLAHLTPAFIWLLIDIPYWLMPEEKKIYWMQMAMTDHSFWKLPSTMENAYITTLACLFLFYWWRQRAQSCEVRKEQTRLWIKQLQTILALAAASLFLLVIASEYLDKKLSSTYIWAPMCAYLVYLVLTHTQLPLNRKIKRHSQEPEKNDVTEVKSIEEQEDKSLYLIFKQLEQSLESGAYKDSTLSLLALAEQNGFTSHQASSAINACHGNNFYDLINEFRVNAAKQALENSESSITDICYEVGYKSKSTFNSAFKKICGCTPTVYRSNL